MNLQDIRAKHPEYNDMSDGDLTAALHKKFYSDMPFTEFQAKLGYAAAQAAPKSSGIGGSNQGPGNMGPRPLDDPIGSANAALIGAGRTLDRGAAGIGQATYGMKSMFGDPMADEWLAQTKKQQDENTRLYQPLKRDHPMATMAGEVAPLLPAPFLRPFAGTTTLGAAAAGAGNAALSAALPAALEYGTPGERFQRTVLGGGVGAFMGGAGAAIGASPKALSLAAPFTQSGREGIAARSLQRSVPPGDMADVLASISAQRGPQYVQGYQPTLAQATKNPGLAIMERGLASSDPQIAAYLSERGMEQNAAHAAALGGIAGDVGKRATYEGMRQQAAQDLYGKAFAETPTVTPWIKGQFTQLMDRPSFVESLKGAQLRAADEGVKLNMQNQTQVAHYAKMELDDMISRAKASGSTQLNGLMSIRDKLLSVMESKDFSPTYREARATYSEMSKPIDQMKVGQALQDKLQPALGDFGGIPRVRADSYAQAVRNGEQTAKMATGFPQPLGNLMTQDQMGVINGIGGNLNARAFASDAGRGAGSNTAQNLAVQNVLEQIVGPSLASAGQKTGMLGYLNSIYKIGGASSPEAKIREILAEAQLNPEYAAQLLAMKPGLFGGQGMIRGGALAGGLLGMPLVSQLD